MRQMPPAYSAVIVPCASSCGAAVHTVTNSCRSAGADCEDHRLGEFLAEDGGRGVDIAGAAQDALVQLQRVEVATVGGKGQLVVGAAVDVVEEGPRQAPLGQQAVVGDGCGDQHGMPRAVGEPRDYPIKLAWRSA